ncbi:hypothetical protein [Phosphitispora sp. TUW77]|uniref:hypothetical protein n=1 Tax=Phosphitispora sp. TUW77 TaxID=3152361 RepID=UPI003AB90F30
MEPVVLALEEKYGEDVQFIIADTNNTEASPLARQFNVYYIPHIVILDGKGNVLYSDIGPQTGDFLEGYLNKAVQTAIK